MRRQPRHHHHQRPARAPHPWRRALVPASIPPPSPYLQVLATIREWLPRAAECERGCHPRQIAAAVLGQLRALDGALRAWREFWRHEWIGSSLLFMADATGRADLKMIDFGVTTPHEAGLRHDQPWVMGAPAGQKHGAPARLASGLLALGPLGQRRLPRQARSRGLRAPLDSMGARLRSWQTWPRLSTARQPRGRLPARAGQPDTAVEPAGQGGQLAMTRAQVCGGCPPCLWKARREEAALLEGCVLKRLTGTIVVEGV